MCQRMLGVGLLVSMLAMGAAAQEIGWPEAVARLARERERAETCAVLVKRLGEAADIDHGRLTYGEAKAEVDAVIAGLITALAEGGAPADLSTLEARLAAGVARREDLCEQARALMPPAEGERPFMLDLFTDALPALIEAVVTLVNASAERMENRDRLTRATITTQLEATRWPSFAAVQSSY